MATSNARKERRKALNSRPVVAEIVITAVFDIPNNVSEEELINDYRVRMSGDFKDVDSQLVLLHEALTIRDGEKDNKNVFISKKLMTSQLIIEETYVK